MSNQSILNLLKKIKELADKGVGGEKEAAEIKLKKLMDKHGISIDDLIENDVVETRWFKAEMKYRQLFFQIAGHVVRNERIPYYTHKRSRTLIGIDCSISQMIEIQSMFDFYKIAMENEYKIFYQAFVHKNNLEAGNPSTEIKPKKELTKEEYMEIERIKAYMMGMKDHVFRKQLESKGGES